MTDPIRPPGADATDTLAKAPDVKWLDGKPLPGVLIYTTPERVVALAHKTAPEDGDRSVYGERKGAQLVRPQDGAPLSAFVQGKMLDDILSRPMFAGLRLDERPLLDLEKRPDISTKEDAADWEAPVLGSIDLAPYANGLTLRPTRLKRTVAGDVTTLEFFEAGVQVPPAHASHTLRVMLADGSSEQPRPSVTYLETPAALLLDTAIDGGWESVSPLWLRTHGGFLRVKGKQATLAYEIGQDSRAIDIHGWLAERDLPALTKARLLLDRSGPKTLTVREETGRKPVIELQVGAPALVLLMPEVACAPQSLLDASLPPGPQHSLDAPHLHVVSTALSGARAPSWELKMTEHGALVLTGPPKGTTLTHFAPHGDWVRPPEAAVNGDGAGLSSLRVLLPLVKADADREVRISCTAAGFSPDGLEKVDWDEATALGPLARFSVATKDGKVQATLDSERTSGSAGAVTLEHQPAVLRSNYRGVPANDNEPVASAPYGATYVHPRPDRPPPQAVASAPAPASMAKQGIHWALDAGSAKLRRDDLHDAVSEKRFGWWEGQRFAAGIAGSDPRASWLQADRDGGAWKGTCWVRLTDDSLAKIALDKSSDEVQSIHEADAPWPVGPFQCRSQGVGAREGGLARMALLEEWTAGGLSFQLSLDGNPLWTSPPEPQVVSRLVIARADPLRVEFRLDDNIEVTRLNRLFLELERWGSEFRVRRGMLGWSASHVFDLEKLGPDFHVTEFYERDGDQLVRTLELNGGIGSQELTFEDWKYRVSVYFWSAVVSPGNRLRVICNHEFTPPGSAAVTPVCALQDAFVVGGKLDLSVDIAILGANANQENRRYASDVWEPSRRNLFGVQLDALTDKLLPRGFLKIRHSPAANPSFRVSTLTDQRRPDIIPAWELCNRKITPWFSAAARDRRAQTTWLPAMGLRTAAAGEPKGHPMQVTLYPIGGENKLANDASRACTLVGAEPIDGDVDREPSGAIPLWIPSPIRNLSAPRPGVDAVGALPTIATHRLWLFDPWPRVVKEWQAKPEEAAEQRKDARLTLAKLGWTREAVHESAAAAGAERWDAIDSPLLNRDAGLAWFGWPMAPGAQSPREAALPASTQVVHLPSHKVPATSVQVMFTQDVVGDSYRLPHVFRPAADPDPEKNPIDGILFRTQGLRVGVPHAAVVYCDVLPKVHLIAARKPAPPTLEANVLQLEPGRVGQPGWLTWGHSKVDLPNVEAVSTLANCFRLKLAADAGTQWTHVQFVEAPPGLLVRLDGSDWRPVRPGVAQPIPPATSAIEVRLPESSYWSCIRLSFTQKESEGSVLLQSFFVDESATVGMAGMFVDDDLQAFGNEPIWFKQDADADPPRWTRFSGVRLHGQATPVARLHVARLDMLGQLSVYTP
jgi:hypothetical protein